MIKRKNSIKIFVEGEKKSIGDPFILKHNGVYHLYPSTVDGGSEVHCYTSKNLIDWEYYGNVTNDPITEGAYAPELIYANNYFYMSASPKGHGHYIFRSKSPLGPFERITDNIGQMIDGSFFLDKYNQIYFTRADHKGIAMLKMDKFGNMTERIDLNAEMHGWTEGSFIKYVDGLYYLTYCGNFIDSLGYRVDYATSKTLTGDYRSGINNSLLISTNEEYNSLGHSMTINGPNLLDDYISYHYLYHDPKYKRTRDLSLDKIFYNGRLMSTTPTWWELDLDLADYYSYNLENTIKNKDVIYSNKVTEKEFVAEFFLDITNTSVVLDYDNLNSYKEIIFKGNEVSILDNNNLVKKFKQSIVKDGSHNIRIEAKNSKVKILINNVLVEEVSLILNGGAIGYKSEETLDNNYLAFSNFKVEDKFVLPGNMYPFKNKVKDSDDIYFETLNKGDKVKFDLIGRKEDTYTLSVYANLEFVKFEINGKKYELKKHEAQQYKYQTYKIDDLILSEVAQLEVSVLEGSINYKAFRLELNNSNQGLVTNFKVEDNSFISQTGDNYYLDNDETKGIVETNFKVLEKGHFKRFGLLANVNDLSFHEGQTKFGFNGYFIGFRDNLLVVDKASYGLKRMYDKPYHINEGEVYNIKAVIKDSVIKVYINDKLEITCTDDWAYVIGKNGLYADDNSNVVFNDYKTRRDL